MKTWKLVSGILSMVLFVLVALQSCAAGIADALGDEGGTSGASGLFVAILMLSGGIVSVATKNATGKGGNIALVILFGLASLIGFTGYGNFTDLVIWSVWCLINAVLAGVALFKAKEVPKDVIEKTEE